MSVLQVRCPGCQAALRVPATAAGSKVRCSQCKKVLAIPARPRAAEAAPIASPASAPASAPPPRQPVTAASDEPFGSFDTADADDPFSASTPYTAASSGFSAASSFQPQRKQHDESATPAASAGRPNWLIAVIVAGAFMMVALVGMTGIGYLAYTRSVDAAVAENQAAKAAANAELSAAAIAEQQTLAEADPLPPSWEAQGARGVTVRMPSTATVREVASPIQGQLVLRVDGTDPDSGAKFWLTEMPVAAGTEIRRDMWLRNLYRYSGATAEERVDVRRSGVAGKRILLARDGEQMDPLLEVFVLPDRMVVASVQPANAKRAEAFFASLTLSAGTVDSTSAAADTDLAKASPRSPPVTAAATQPLTGDEARRYKIYLEYRRYAGANTTRAPLPGVHARDAVDRLLGQVNESQTQAFMVLHGLTDKQLGEIITEGNDKSWATR
ncbi:hypothetical protein Poly24_20980 [Rosistilla carotiformis]|uniref:Zinc finger/thioredoxin putative domain-containing protein n=1 Tax=Rosistilla carotiformis TaxID=2528017 RepID=A0A518JS68_9BACT|nr:MJ0042-type zinc finger domain-containing protein [Rosistilla carotiformis]QDV68389.1 hypothetical protein Poly24_20980 [Rosistilla carotiformis]